MTDMTPIQSQIVELRALPLTHAEIGDRLGITVGTVDHQIKKLRKAGMALPRRRKVDTSVWTPTRIAKIKAMWHEGNSAGVIAAAISLDARCHISRNAVIGKLTRLGLNRSGKPSTRTKNQGHRPARKRRVITMPGGEQAEQPRFDVGNFTRWAGKRMDEADKPPVIALPPAEVWSPLPGIKPVTQAALGLRTCRWPVEDGKKRFGLDHLYCGAEAPLGEPYCERHALQAIPAARRKAA